MLKLSKIRLTEKDADRRPIFGPRHVDSNGQVSTPVPLYSLPTPPSPAAWTPPISRDHAEQSPLPSTSEMRRRLPNANRSSAASSSVTDHAPTSGLSPDYTLE